MIKVSRPSAVPASLTSQAVQQYLQSIAAYVANPSLPKPPKPSGYRNSDLLKDFTIHFYAKCYLTEQRFANAEAMDVDHFEPANQNPSRVFDWTNLYPAAHKANMMRPRTLPVDGLLDPCVGDEVETEIIYTLGAHGEEPGFKAKDPANQKAVNTAALLDELHNGKRGSADSHQNTLELRKLIERRYKEVLFAWGEYNQALAKNSPQDIAQAETELRALLSRRASFTMLMRSLRFIRTQVSHLFD